LLQQIRPSHGGPNFQNWNGGEGENGCCGDAGYYHHHWGGVGEYDSLYAQQSGPYQNGWHAGQQDAIYDHNNTIQ